MDDLTWGALALTLTVLGALWTWVSFRRRGAASGLRALAFTLLPLAAYLTRTLRMFTRVAEAVADWATHLVLDPTVWVGIVLAALSAALFTASRFLRARTKSRSRGADPSDTRSTRAARSARPAAGSVGPAGRRGEPAIDDDMAEIEALLRKRGIE